LRAWRTPFSLFGGNLQTGATNTDPYLARFVDTAFSYQQRRYDQAIADKIHAKLGYGAYAYFSDDGRIVAVQGESELTAWDVSVETPRLLARQTARAFQFSKISPNGEYFVYWDLKEKSLRLWRISSNTITSLPSSGDWPTAIVFSDDGRELIAATHIGNLDVYDTQSASLSHRISTSDRVGTIGASSDFTLAATTGRVTQIWDLQKGIPLATLEASPWPADWFKFSRDKRLVLSTHPVLQVWDAASGKLLVSSVPLQGGEWVTITSEGFFDASLNGAKSLNVVRGLESYSIDQFYDALHRPDLVREKLAGDPQGKVREAAAKLDLSKAVASGSAPRVSIVAPASGTTATGEQMTVEASLADQGGGFGKVEWRVNGTTLGVDAGTTRERPARADGFSTQDPDA
jgi:WD40 repeat protein